MLAATIWSLHCCRHLCGVLGQVVLVVCDRDYIAPTSKVYLQQRLHTSRQLLISTPPRSQRDRKAVMPPEALRRPFQRPHDDHEAAVTVRLMQRRLHRHLQRCVSRTTFGEDAMGLRLQLIRQLEIVPLTIHLAILACKANNHVS